MTRDTEGQLAQSVWEQLRENFRVAGKTLFTLRQKLSLPENGFYVIEQTLGDNIGNIARIPIVCELKDLCINRLTES